MLAPKPDSLRRCQRRFTLAELLSEPSIDFSTRRTLGPLAAYGLSALVFLSPCLEDLTARENHLGDAGVAAIASALDAAPHSRLASLHLAKTGAGARAAKAVCAMLESGQIGEAAGAHRT